MQNKNTLARLLAPRSIAIVGASSKKGKVGTMLVHNICDYGYTGTVFFVNHKTKKIRGRKTYPHLDALPQDVDVAIIAIPSAYVHDVIAAGAAKCKNFVVISAGFGETGIAGHNREMQLDRLARARDLTIVGPNCLGFLTPRLKLNASFAPGLPMPGDIAFVSQSGALAVALVDRAAALGIGFSSVVSIGNKMQITEVDLLEHFAQDTHTKVVMLYLESLVGGTAFLRAASRARKKGKRVIIIKSGKTDAAQKAIALHTGSLTSGNAVVDAVFAKSGIMRAQTVDDLFTLSAFARACASFTKDPRVAVVTNAGGPGVLTTDAIAQTKHLTLAEFSHTFQKKLAAQLPSAASVHNPIDLLGDALTDRYQTALDALVTNRTCDVIMVLLTPQEQTPSAAIARLLVRMQKKTSKVIIASFIGGHAVAAAREILRAGGVLHTETPEAAVHALDLIVETDRTHTFSLRAPMQDDARQKRTQTIITQSAQNGSFYFSDVQKLAHTYGIPISTAWDITDGFGTTTPVTYPCVAKVDDPHILHKSDRGGVLLPIGSAAALARARATLRKRFPEETARIIAQPLLPRAMELIVGMKRDPVFGPVVVVGIGGIYTEIFKKTTLFVPPYSEKEVTRRLTTGALDFLFRETRGQAPYDLARVVHLVMALQMMGQEHATIAAIDINPLLLYNDGHPAVAVDMKVVL